MRPLEALMDAIGLGIFNEYTRRLKKPGDIINKMSPEHREALAKLTSDDAQKVRMDLFLDRRRNPGGRK